MVKKRKRETKKENKDGRKDEINCVCNPDLKIRHLPCVYHHYYFFSQPPLEAATRLITTKAEI